MAGAHQDGLSSNLEDYLETIFHLEQESRVARAKDIAERLEVSRASVTGALKTLADKDLINYEPYSYVTLTAQGEKIAREIDRRHHILKGFFRDILQLGNEAAEANACRVEHAMDQAAIDRLVNFLDFLEHCPRTGGDWLESFEGFCRGKASPDNCRQCLADCLERGAELT
ncbi:MAG: metal-dependent transcriptional regulator [Desulfarculaceae bacterium]|nr:metal-dependent transcriptional regulator [Desulfarculaceae bacterium]MCF8074140.1 metal-dependent transcriptional regulator [Desulfarculaceae bacterium]MCF8103268.1 metal-dependent transcriptional regulator [Desulfarculaceae bacterium]MCF8116874.1 metal-dependent transcriptional regulator [Desulfarculaceae bacterium]